jgi:hypothetical protein
MIFGQLALSIGKHHIHIAELLTEDKRSFGVMFQEELTFQENLYTELLDKGNPKVIKDVAARLSEILSRSELSEVSVCINMTGAKCLTTHFNRDLDNENFEDECDQEAAIFLRDPDDYVCEPMRLDDATIAPFESYCLVFTPKRFMTRLKMILLPSRKTLHSVEFSHAAMQHLFQRDARKDVLVECESDYLAVSQSAPAMQQFKYWKLDAETDMAYFTLSELKNLKAVQMIYAVGDNVGESFLSFISSTLGRSVERLAIPNYIFFQAKPAAPERYLQSISCAVKAIDEMI